MKQTTDQLRTELVQTRLTPSEMAKLDDFVRECRNQGIEATRSSVIRSLIADAVKTYMK